MITAKAEKAGHARTPRARQFGASGPRLYRVFGAGGNGTRLYRYEGAYYLVPVSASVVDGTVYVTAAGGGVQYARMGRPIAATGGPVEETYMRGTISHERARPRVHKRFAYEGGALTVLSPSTVGNDRASRPYPAGDATYFAANLCGGFVDFDRGTPGYTCSRLVRYTP